MPPHSKHVRCGHVRPRWPIWPHRLHGPIWLRHASAVRGGPPGRDGGRAGALAAAGLGAAGAGAGAGAGATAAAAAAAAAFFSRRFSLRAFLAALASSSAAVRFFFFSFGASPSAIAAVVAARGPAATSKCVSVGSGNLDYLLEGGR